MLINFIILRHLWDGNVLRSLFFCFFISYSYVRAFCCVRIHGSRFFILKGVIEDYFYLRIRFSAPISSSEFAIVHFVLNSVRAGAVDRIRPQAFPRLKCINVNSSTINEIRSRANLFAYERAYYVP